MSSNDEHCISAVTWVVFAGAGQDSISTAAVSDAFQARFRYASLFARSLYVWPFIISAFQDVSSAASVYQRCVSCANSRKIRNKDNKDTEPGRVLGYPAVLPSTSCIQLIDIQLSQVEMMLFLHPPHCRKAMACLPVTSPIRHRLRVDSITPLFTRFHRAKGGRKLACVRPPPVSR